MTEQQAIEYASNLEPLEKLRYYMDYFCDCLYHKYTAEIYKEKPEYFNPTSFEDYCSKERIRVHDVGEDWKKRGYASKSWVVLPKPSIFHTLNCSL